MEKKQYQAPEVLVYTIDLDGSLCIPGSIPVGGEVETLDAPIIRRSPDWDNYENSL